jgi:integrase
VHWRRSSAVSRPDVDFEAVEVEHLASVLDARKISHRTRATWISPSHVFFGRAITYAREIFKPDPTDRLPRPCVPVDLPRPIPTCEVIRSIETAGPQMHVWTSLEALGGFRYPEIAGLVAKNIDWEEPAAGLLGIGRKWRTIPLHEDMALALKPLSPPRHGPLWMNALTGTPYTPACVFERIDAHLDACGSTSTVHQLRHWCATHAHRATQGHSRRPRPARALQPEVRSDLRRSKHRCYDERRRRTSDWRWFA